MNAISIVEVETDGPLGILVTFSDGTIAGYVVEELIESRPHRDRVEIFVPLPETSIRPQVGFKMPV